MKKNSRPLNSIQEKAYAEKAAMRIGMIVAGTATATELKNAVIRASSPAVSTSL